MEVRRAAIRQNQEGYQEYSKDRHIHPAVQAPAVWRSRRPDLGFRSLGSFPNRHRQYEPIAPFRHSFDHWRLPIAEHLSQLGDVLSERQVLDKAVGPDTAHELVFCDQTTGILDQHEERIEDFRAEWNGRTVAQQQMLGGIETPIAKLVNLVDRSGHIGTLESSQDFISKISEFCKDVKACCTVSRDCSGSADAVFEIAA